MLRNSASRFVHPSIGWSVGRSVTFYFSYDFQFFWFHRSYPIGYVTSNMPTVHPHAIGEDGRGISCLVFFLFGISFSFFPFLMRPLGTHLYRRVCPSVHPSIHPSVHPSVGRLVSYNCAKIVSLSWFGHDELLYWSKWSTNIFWEPYLQLGCSTRLSVHLSFHICHMINHCRKLMILETMLYSV